MTLQRSAKLLVSAVALTAAAACVPDAANYSSAENLKRNEVQMVRLTHQLRFSADGTLTSAETAGLNQFLNQNGIRYGDILSLDVGDIDGGNWQSTVHQTLLARGLKLDPRTVVSGPVPPIGAAVLVVDRYVVSLPDCNNNAQEPSDDWANQRSPNYGCSTQALLGLMVANPQDLVQGKNDDGPNAKAATTAVETHAARAGTGQAAKSGGGVSAGAGSGRQ